MRRKISATASIPTATATSDAPSYNSKWPKSKRGVPSVGSSPTVASSRPRSAATAPLISESPISPAITANAKTISARTSIGPIFSASKAIGAEATISTRSEKVSPVTEA